MAAAVVAAAAKCCPCRVRVHVHFHLFTIRIYDDDGDRMDRTVFVTEYTHHQKLTKLDNFQL